MMTTRDLLSSAGLNPADIHLPAGGVAVFGRSGTGKSTLFYWSEFIKCLILADTGSLAHKLYARHNNILIVDSTADISPVDQVLRKVEECMKTDTIFLLDSWTTLQEAMVAWWKRGSTNARGPAVNLKDHNAIVGRFRDLALVLAQAQGFTVMNTSPGGRGKNPDGQEVVYPAGCVTGYPSLNGTNANSETILARWGSVWGVFQGHKSAEKNVDIPRGLYVPGHDIRPESHALYSPLKDPMMVIRDTSDGRGIMVVPDLRDPANHGRCFADEVLIEMAKRWPRRRPSTQAANENAQPTPPGVMTQAASSEPPAPSKPSQQPKGGPKPPPTGKAADKGAGGQAKVEVDEFGVPIFGGAG